MLKPFALILLSVLTPRAFAECSIAAQSTTLDPVEVGYCESDAVFVGRVEQIIESIHAYTEPGSDRTKHFDTQRSTVKVTSIFKGQPADKVTLVSELYDKDRAYVFQSGKSFLIFAKKLAGENDYAGASEKCSVQPTLPIESAKAALKRLNELKQRKIDCKVLESKANP